MFTERMLWNDRSVFNQSECSILINGWLEVVELGSSRLRHWLALVGIEHAHEHMRVCLGQVVRVNERLCDCTLKVDESESTFHCDDSVSASFKLFYRHAVTSLFVNSEGL